MRQQLPARVESAEAERGNFAYHDLLYSAATFVLWLVKSFTDSFTTHRDSVEFAVASRGSFYSR